MAEHKRGRSSFVFSHSPVITTWASVAGKRESEGPLGNTFDVTSQNTMFGQKSWEQAERKMQELALKTLAEKSGLQTSDFDLVLSGDLLNQCIGSSFSLRNMNIPHLGLYGACSTMAESLLLSAVVVDGGFTDQTVALTSSHFASSERQFRFPLGYGGQRTPTAQWTVTGAGCALVSSGGHGPRITAATVGTVRDLGILDTNNMGAAMAPAAYSTLQAHFEDLKTTVDDYDQIFTGDLGHLGRALLVELAAKDGISLDGKLKDCGCMVFDNIHQDVHSGGSGCGCSAIVLCGHILDSLQKGTWNKILFCGTGALLSPTSIQQKLPIPGVCHAVAIERGI